MTNTTKKLSHHELTAEWVNDSQGSAIMLTQLDGSGCNEAATILLDPWQLRATCEHFGLIANDQAAHKTIAMLKRRLLVLRDRIDHLGEYMEFCSDHDHANLEYEQGYVAATHAIAQEFCADLDDLPDSTTVGNLVTVPVTPTGATPTQPALI